MVELTYYLCLSCLLILIPGIKSDHNPNLTFSCPGNETSIADFNYGIQIGDVCGEQFVLEFDGAARPLPNGQLRLYFSSDDEFNGGDNDAVEVLSINWGASASKRSVLDNTPLTTVSDLPCGSGYLVAVVKDGNTIVEQGAERIIKTCDSIGVDVEIEVSDVSNDSLIKLSNKGSQNLPNTTKEGAHLLAVYLQKPTYFGGSGCTIPNLTVFDAVLNFTTFTRGMMVGEEMFIDQSWVDQITASFDGEKPTICGDADLVFMFDPFYQYDNNPCNNFKKFRVHINCNNIPYKQKCYSIINDPHRGLCRMADRLDSEYEEKIMKDYMNDTDYMTTTEMPTTETTDNPQVISARNTIEMLKMQLSSNSLPDWTSFQNGVNAINGIAYMAPVDMVQKYKFHGIALGLNLSYHYAYYKTMYPNLPSNTSRLVLGHALRGLASYFIKVYKSAFSGMEKEMYLGPLVMYLSALETAANHMPVPEPLNSMMPRIRRLIISFVKQYKDVGYKPEIRCPFRFHDLESVPPIGRFLIHLADASREDVKEEPDTVDQLERCRRRLVATYFRYGGKSIIARDIHRQMISDAKGWGFDDDGRIKIGFKSPWNAGFMLWRVIGVCSCDQCNGGYNANQYSTTTPSYGYYGNATYGYGSYSMYYPSSSSVYNG
ncbi:hypothetical protein KUTeg_015912 [Tegillarca granosa]|uniref:Uncharacterized protein n=1 Tax=Tegillarca granosa TaxID=220873 RepID=A0ABQ9EP33_TEGGR|nr:hypothetical protein KUTeg_015912 [Tegillarca granosa]